ncbi:hypothetical protein E6O75_ATG08168 [Venturia nashicola]|uniref:Uncharacterized protein n=1 Tax=Venturia nashicola TaxID=86259 RepID=A0A4Z1NN64_9PEZI|nr:hypothetical protein E6O75_ATG08168 [Venturia nashicola]
MYPSRIFLVDEGRDPAFAQLSGCTDHLPLTVNHHPFRLCSNDQRLISEPAPFVLKKAYIRPSYLSFSFDALHVLSKFPTAATEQRASVNINGCKGYRKTMGEQSRDRQKNRTTSARGLMWASRGCWLSCKVTCTSLGCTRRLHFLIKAAQKATIRSQACELRTDEETRSSCCAKNFVLCSVKHLWTIQLNRGAQTAFLLCVVTMVRILTTDKVSFEFRIGGTDRRACTLYKLTEDCDRSSTKHRVHSPHGSWSRRTPLQNFNEHSQPAMDTTAQTKALGTPLRSSSKQQISVDVKSQPPLNHETKKYSISMLPERQ